MINIITSSRQAANLTSFTDSVSSPPLLISIRLIFGGVSTGDESDLIEIEQYRLLMSIIFIR